MKEQKNKPYLISFTAGGLLFDETISLKSYLNKEMIEQIRNEIKDNKNLQTNSESARQRIIQEIRKRYYSVDDKAFNAFGNFKISEQKIFLYFLCLKTYPIIFDFIFEVLIEKWLSLYENISTNDVLIFLDKKSSSHSEIDQWADTTKDKIASVLIRILKEVGIIYNGKINALNATDDYWKYYVNINESWFLNACLLNKSERDQIKNV